MTVAAQPSLRKPLLRVALEVLLISLGVFLGLAGDQWRERAERRELAETSLRRFRSEIETNRTAVAGVSDYHVDSLKRLRAYLAVDRDRRNKADLRLQGLQPVAFERTAWDLALATDALTDIDSELAFALSRTYNAQESYEDLTSGVTQAMYLLPLRENFDGFAAAAETYFADLVLMEPKLLQLYDELLLRIDRALGE
jgi:hypothetical protein